MSHPSPTAVSVAPAEKRLDSWKEIAVYLNRGVTTVQRWERDEGLPVHRQQHDALGSVYAYKPELEAWRVKRDTRVAAEASADVKPEVAADPGKPKLHLAAMVAGALVAGLIIGAGIQSLRTHETSRGVKRLSIVTSSTAPMQLSGTDRSLAITPDGQHIIYIGGMGGSRLNVRSIDQLDVMTISGVGAARFPFTSPDSQWIGFFDRNILKKVPITGGPPTTLADATLDSVETSADVGTNAARRAGSRGATWGGRNRIAFAMGDRLLSVSADGGKVEILASPDVSKGEAAYNWPEFLPDDRGVLFTILPAGDWSEKGSRTSIASAQVAVLDPQTKQRKVLIEGGSHAHYVEGGYLVYATSNALKAAAFDLRTLAIVGTPKTVVAQVATTNRGAANFDVSRDGTLIYVPTGVESDLVNLMWVDRQGREDAVGAPPFVYRHPRLSPDGKRVALDSPRDIGLWDIAAGTLSWLGVGPASQLLWTPDGQRLIFASTGGGPAILSAHPVSGTQSSMRLTHSTRNQFPNTISPDGTHLIFREDAATSNLMDLDLRGDHTPAPLGETPFRQLNADFSPDGRFLVYQSNQSGQDEIYVRTFPIESGKPWMVSSGGGKQPLWSRDGQEIFFVSLANIMMSAPIQRASGGFVAGKSARVFERPYYFGNAPISGRAYDYSARDGRFLMLKSTGDTESAKPIIQIDVVLNWLEELNHNFRQ